MKILPFPLFFCCLFFDLSNEQTCTSPVYSNSGVTIRGPCPSSQVIAPVGSIIKFDCSYSYTGVYLTVWNTTDIEPIISVNVPPNSSIDVTVSGSGNGFTTLSLPVSHEDFSSDVQCGLCKGGECFPLQLTVVSLPVQLISFGK